MKDILALNKISPLVNDVLKGKYNLADQSNDPVGIIVRSFKMHDYEPASSVLCVGRAGAGTNNIPVDKYAEKGIVVFNTPGANANAVSELILASLFLCGRKIIPAISWAQGLKTDVAAEVEKGKGQFVGGEIKGKTLGVYGLGAIGKLVAVGAAALGMKVLGYNRTVTDELRKFLTSHNVTIVNNVDELYEKSDYFTINIPYSSDSKECINKKRIDSMKNGVNIINCARGELVNNADMKAALASGKVNRYVTDFPTEEVLGVENIITIPHLGASTPEAEDNCAVMAGNQMVDYIENGTIKNSVNFPDVSLGKTGKSRLVVLCNNNCDIEKLPEQVKKIIGGAITGCECKKGKTASAAIFDFADKIDAGAAEALSKKCDCILKVRIV